MAARILIQVTDMPDGSVQIIADPPFGSLFGKVQGLGVHTITPAEQYVIHAVNAWRQYDQKGKDRTLSPIIVPGLH